MLVTIKGNFINITLQDNVKVPSTDFSLTEAGDLVGHWDSVNK